MSSLNLGIRTVLRTTLVIVAVVGALYLTYLLRRPLGWLVIAAFVAIALSAPVGLLARRIPRGAAIAVVYLGACVVPLALGALIVPGIVENAVALARDLPRYVDDAIDLVNRNDFLRGVDEQFDIGSRLADLADDAPSHLGDAAGLLSSVGLGLVDSLFSIFTILVLSAFMVASGPRWVRASVGLVPQEHRERTERALDRIAVSVAGYVRAQLTIALIAAVAGYLVMTALGVPFREPLAVLIAVGSLIPVVGSLAWGVVIGLVTVAAGFPTMTILWVIWAVVYPQIENYVLQPQLQKRAVHIEPFVIIVAVLFGATLLGIVGALLAIPAAAAIQIVIAEWWSWRQERAGEEPGPAGPGTSEAAAAGPGATGAEAPDGRASASELSDAEAGASERD